MSYLLNDLRHPEGLKDESLEALCHSAADHIAALTARVAELERDAARYRYLRDRDSRAVEIFYLCGFYGSQADEAVDAYLAKQPDADGASRKALNELHHTDQEIFK